MNDDFDRDALFSDIDKIMEKQGYSNVSSASSPIEIEASDMATLGSIPAPSQELLDKIEQVVNPRTREDAKVTQPSIRPEDTLQASIQEPLPDTVPEPASVSESTSTVSKGTQPEEITPSSDFERVSVPEETPDSSANIETPVPESGVVSHNLSQPVKNPKNGRKNEPEDFVFESEKKKQPPKETIMPPDSEAAPMFTTIENPVEWSLGSEEPEGESEMYTEPDKPAVSYLEGASTDGVAVENVAFGDISVGVETESVEYNIGHPLLRLLRNILICVAAALLLSLLITKFVAHHTSVDGSSMESTLTDGDQLIVQQLSYYFHEPERFDVIVFPISTEDNYIKRIIGLPGETVQIRDGQVYINGSLLTEDRFGSDLMQDPGTAADTIYLQSDEYFVLGDNRNASVDSRFPEVGLIHKKDIKGKAWLRFYPFGSFGFVK